MSGRSAPFIRFLLLVAPQILVSAAAIWIFTRAFFLPPRLVQLHVLTIAAGQLVFFLIIGAASRQAWLAQHAGARRTITALIPVKGALINGLYLASFGTNSAWGSNLTWSNLAVFAPHLIGFREAFGGIVWLALGLVVAAIAALGVLAWRRGEKTFAKVQAAFPAGETGWAAIALTFVIVLAAGIAWATELEPRRLRQTDPIISLWSSDPDMRELQASAVLADARARETYMVPAHFRRRTVLVFSVDCMRADHLSFYGYRRPTTPFLAELHAQGRVQVGPPITAVGNNSPYGIFGILGSRWVEQQHPGNFKLPDLLKRAGYRLHLVAAGDHTSFDNMRALYGPDWDVFLDGLTFPAHSVNEDRGILDQLASLPPAGDAPAFFFFHLMSPHTLAPRDPAFAIWTGANSDGQHPRAYTGKIDVVARTNAYDNGLRKADEMIRGVMAILSRKGYLHDYIGVVTGDHGEGLGEHGNFGHTRFLHHEDVQVPLLFLDSDSPGPLTASFASQVDIAPTLLHRLGLPRPPHWVGINLEEPEPLPRTIYLTGKLNGPWRGVIRHDRESHHKYLFRAADDGEFLERLFDLRADPEETMDLAPQNPPALNELRRAAEAHFRRPLPRT